MLLTSEELGPPRELTGPLWALNGDDVYASVHEGIRINEDRRGSLFFPFAVSTATTACRTSRSRSALGPERTPTRCGFSRRGSWSTGMFPGRRPGNSTASAKMRRGKRTSLRPDARGTGWFQAPKPNRTGGRNRFGDRGGTPQRIGSCPRDAGAKEFSASPRQHRVHRTPAIESRRQAAGFPSRPRWSPVRPDPTARFGRSRSCPFRGFRFPPVLSHGTEPAMGGGGPVDRLRGRACGNFAPCEDSERQSHRPFPLRSETHPNP